MELISKSFESQCLALPSRVDATLAKVSTVEEAKDLLDKSVAMQAYADQLKAGVDIERPIAIGVLKIKAKIGELAPAKVPKETGAMEGKKGGKAALLPFPKPTLTAYRKLHKHKDKLENLLPDSPSPRNGEIGAPMQKAINVGGRRGR